MVTNIHRRKKPKNILASNTGFSDYNIKMGSQ